MRSREAFRAAHTWRRNEDEEVVHIWSRWEAKTHLQWREMMKYCTYTLHGVTRCDGDKDEKSAFIVRGRSLQSSFRALSLDQEH